MINKEVEAIRHQEMLGPISVVVPLSHWLSSMLAFILGSTTLLFLVFGHYTRRETVTGQLVPSAGLLKIAAASAGTITQLYVREGQTVKAGDKLFELTGHLYSTNFGETHAIIAQKLNAQRSELKSDLQQQEKLLRQRDASLRRQIKLLNSELIQVKGQLDIRKEVVAGNKELYERIRPLMSNGYVSATQLQQYHLALLDAQGQLKSMLRQQFDIRQQLDIANQQLAQLPIEFTTKRNDIERQIAIVDQSIAQNDTQGEIVQRAARDGVVSTILFGAGQMVNAGQPLMSILPLDSPLQAQLLVPSRAIGFIKQGGRVVLRYDAFPYQKFGQQYGSVTDVSRSALTPAEIRSLIGEEAQTPLYRVQVALDRQYVVAYGKDETIKPGMSLNADILLDRRTLLEWVFAPLRGTE
jgi:membrane fusion protein